MATSLPEYAGLLSNLVLDPELLLQQPAGIGDVDSGVARLLRRLLFLRPEDDQLQRLLAAYDEASATGRTAPHRHHSRLRPTGDQAFFGAVQDFPLASALAAGVNLPEHGLWDLIALLTAAEVILPRLGRYCAPLETPYRRELEVWLRNAHKGTRLRDMALAIGHASSPAEILESPAVGGKAGKLQEAVKQAAAALLAPPPASRVRGSTDDVWSPRAARIVKHPQPLLDADDDLPPEERHFESAIEIDPQDPVFGPIAQRELVRIASARQHAHLLTAECLATQRECRELAAAVHQALAESVHTGALGAGLVMATACSPLEVMLAPVCTSLERAVDAVQSHPLVILNAEEDRCCVLQRVVRPPECFQRAPTNELAFEPHCSFVVQGLPSVLARWLPRDDLGALGVAYPDIEAATRRFAAHVRLSSGGRQHLGRVRRALYSEIISATGDECIAQLVLPGADVPVGQGAYYAATTVGRAFDLHAQSCSAYFHVPSEPPGFLASMANSWIGSAVNPPLGRVAGDLATLRDRTCRALRGRRSVPSLVAAVNQVTCYTLTLLQILTGRRPSREDWRWSDFDIGLKVALIADKAVPGRPRRIVPLPEVALEQLDAYAATIRVACDATREVAPALAKLLAVRLGPDGVFRWIHDDGACWRESPIHPTKLLADLPSLATPLNTNRHLLLQQLMAAGLSRELISYLAGHAEAGQALFSPMSSVSPAVVLCELRKAIDDYASAIGAKSSHGLRPYARRARQARLGIAA